MRELNVNCNLYLKIKDGETAEEARERLERLLEDNGIEYSILESEEQEN